MEGNSHELSELPLCEPQTTVQGCPGWQMAGFTTPGGRVSSTTPSGRVSSTAPSGTQGDRGGAAALQGTGGGAGETSGRGVHMLALQTMKSYL